MKHQVSISFIIETDETDNNVWENANEVPEMFCEHFENMRVVSQDVDVIELIDEEEED